MTAHPTITKPQTKATGAAYVELMGGGTCKRAELPLRANYFIEPESGRYDEDVAKFSGLLLACGREIKTRLRTWTITTGEKLSPENPENSFLRTGPPGVAPLEFCQ
ncbi:MAG: hypothetical protein COA75_12480 [Cellvibrionales bacterium]|nr:MAG: hypothetical protein COA75_12480 [Cellvibrionales bacterium]